MSDDANKDFISSREIEVAKLIRAESPFFSNITVLTCADGDTNAKIEESLAKLGLFLLVEIITEGRLPGIDDTEPWPIWITISENPILNRGTGEGSTGKTARMALEELARLCDETLSIGAPRAVPVFDENQLIVRVIGSIIVKIEKRK